MFSSHTTQARLTMEWARQWLRQPPGWVTKLLSSSVTSSWAGRNPSSRIYTARKTVTSSVIMGLNCASWSRIRFTGRFLTPLPVRDRANLLGLPSNSPEQQKEADAGTLGAVRSAEMCVAVREASVRSGYRSTSTGENPVDPGVDPFPSSFLLPEWISISNDDAAETATFPLCTKGSIEGKIFGKRLTFKGWLRGLASLSAECSCS